MLAGLKLSRNLYRQVIDHLAASLPNEGVGLIATVDEGGYRRAVAFLPGTNVDQSPTRYTMDPVEVLSAFRVMGANGWRLGAIAHSHIASPATPSETDLREAYYPEALQLIVSFRVRRTEARVWRLPEPGSSAGPVEADLVIDPVLADSAGHTDGQELSMPSVERGHRSHLIHLDD